MQNPNENTCRHFERVVEFPVFASMELPATSAVCRAIFTSRKLLLLLLLLLLLRRVSLRRLKPIRKRRYRNREAAGDDTCVPRCTTAI